MIRKERDFFGFERLHYHQRSGIWAHSMQDVLKALNTSNPGFSTDIKPCITQRTGFTPDIAAIEGYLHHKRLPGHTVLSEIHAVPPGYALEQTADNRLQLRPVPLCPRPGDLEVLLKHALGQALNSGKKIGLALSGGLDSALLLALLQRMNALSKVKVYILVSNIPDYCERDAALELARAMDTPVTLIQVAERDFVLALPDTVRAIEEPVFNLHPVAKLLLAQAMARDGIGLAITGDGADQVLRRDQSANYLPLCNALFRAAGIGLSTPFLNPDVVAHVVSLPADPHQQCLRALGARLNLPARLVHGAKRSRLAPAMNLSSLPEAAHIGAMAQSLGLATPVLNTDDQHVLWVSMTLLLSQLGVFAPDTRSPQQG